MQTTCGAATSTARGLGLALLLALSMAAGAAAQDARFDLHLGVERASGDYGGTSDLSDLYVPLTVSYAGDRFGFRATVPYLEVEFADAVSQTTYTESGLGDVILGLTAYDVLRSADGSLVLDVTTKLKLGTADEQKGLGTGENDYSVQAEIYKFLGSTTLAVTAGYKIRGAPADLVVDDTWSMSAGGFYHLSPARSIGLFVDVRQSSVPGNESIRELMASVSQQLTERWRLQAYLLRGLSDTSLDWGAGLSARIGL